MHLSALVLTHVEDGVAWLTLNRASSLNAINPAMVFQLHQALRAAIAADHVQGIVLQGAGKALAAGADLAFFLRNLDAHDFARIRSFTEAGHALLADIDACPKPVIACASGAALGAGLELALACDRILLGPRASLGLPEATLGLYPGMGGMPRLTRRIGLGLAKWMIYTGRILSAKEAATIGLAHAILSDDELPGAARQAAQSTLPPRPPTHCPNDLISLQAFFQSRTLDQILGGSHTVPPDPKITGAVRRIRDNSPTALRLAERILDAGYRLPLPAALQLELDHLEELFSLQDLPRRLSMPLGGQRTGRC